MDMLCIGLGSGYNKGMKRQVLHLASIAMGHAFRLSYSHLAPRHADKVLNGYIALRRMQPRMECGKHWGNHDGSKKRPIKACLGER